MRSATYIRRSLHAIALILLALSVTRVSAAASDTYQTVNDTWDQFGAVYGRVLDHYYKDLDHEGLMRAAIDGMLRELDSYSQFFDAEALRQLRQDTTGKFAGLGLTVGIKDHYPVVISPIENTPADRAGLMPGDFIVTIEGRETFGMTLEEVVKTLRGEPGTDVRIGISRRGEHDRWEVVIERETIKINSVAVWGQIAPHVGYISMRKTRFSEETGAEVELALEELLAADVRSLILDLRGNPGGLLSQATQVADLFLAKGDPIVSIRERDDGRQEMRLSQRAPVAGDLPLVVLIDGGSASAAEIVAGAIQDNDRGLVVGTTSFGKGSVQTIFDLLDRKSVALKLTTALYYTPSGRSIHRQGVSSPKGMLLRMPFGDAEVPAGLLLATIAASPDQETAAAQLRARFELDDAEVERILATPLGELVGSSEDGGPVEPGAENEEYQTRNGRQVFGGGGIAPDVAVEFDRLPAYVRELQRRRVFLDFVVDYVGQRAEVAAEVTVDETMLEAFREFVPATAATERLNREGLDEVAALRRLAAEIGWHPEALSAIDTLESILGRKGTGVTFSGELEPYVRAGLKRELVHRLEGKRASLMAELATDSQARQAVEIVENEDRYRQLLKGG